MVQYEWMQQCDGNSWMENTNTYMHRETRKETERRKKHYSYSVWRCRISRPYINKFQQNKPKFTTKHIQRWETEAKTKRQHQQFNSQKIGFSMHTINTHICGKHLDAYVIIHKFVVLSLTLLYCDIKNKNNGNKEKKTNWSEMQDKNKLLLALEWKWNQIKNTNDFSLFFHENNIHTKTCTVCKVK